MYAACMNIIEMRSKPLRADPFSPRDRMIMLFWTSEDYRDFLIALCEEEWVFKLKSKSRIATCLNVSPSFVSKVFAKKAHLGLEQLQTLAIQLDFNEAETGALIDKAILARSDSTALKTVVKKRIKQSFDRSFSTPVESVQRKRAFRPTNGLYYRIANLITGDKFWSLKDISTGIRMSEERTRVLLSEMLSYFDFEVRNAPNAESYRIDPIKSRTRDDSIDPQDRLDFDMGMRRLAQQSLASRLPLRIVEHGDHFVASSFMILLTDDEIKSLQTVLSQIGKKVSEHAEAPGDNSPRKWVGFCLDFFEASV